MARQSTSPLFENDYFRIPHFAYTYLAQQVKDKSAEDCATLCSESTSFAAPQKPCMHAADRFVLFDRARVSFIQLG